MADPVSTVVFYDCEATSLDGFPIEIGWAFHDAGSDRVIAESHLVRPAADWDLNDAWDQDAEHLHQISQDELLRYGEVPYAVATAMNRALAGRELYADSPEDVRWLTMLFDAAGVEFAFEVRRTLAGVYFNATVDRFGIGSHGLAYILQEANRIAPHTHRAAADAANWAWRAALLHRYVKSGV